MYNNYTLIELNNIMNDIVIQHEKLKLEVNELLNEIDNIENIINNKINNLNELEKNYINIVEEINNRDATR